MRRYLFDTAPRGALEPPRQDPEELIRQASSRPLSAADFERLGCVGAGSYGQVYVWRHKLTGTVSGKILKYCINGSLTCSYCLPSSHHHFTGTAFAVKSMDKRVLRFKASVHTVIRELACSLAVHSNYVATFDFVFCDTSSVYAGMRMYWKGDLERWVR